MANRSLGTLTLDLIASIGGFTGPLDKAARATQKASNEMGASLKSLSQSAALIGVGAAAGFGVLVKHAINVQDQLSKTSQKIGVSVEDLSALTYSADLAGVDVESLASALGKFSKNIGEAYTTGVGAAANALADLGLKVTDAGGSLKSTNTLFLDVAERFAHLDDGAVKTALAMDLFGKSGAELIPLLNAGAQGLNESALEAKRLGQVFDGEAAKAAENFNDNLTRLQKAIGGVANRVATEALPTLVEFSQTLADPAFQKGISDLAQGFITVGVQSAKALATVADFARFLGESVAANVGGVASDDIVRLEDQLADLKKQLNPDFFSFEIPLDATVAQQQIADTQQKIDAFYAHAGELAQQQAARQPQNEKKGFASEPSAAPDVQILTAAEIKANRERREALQKRIEAEAAAAKTLQKHFEDTRQHLQQEITLYGQQSKAAQLAFDTESGELKTLTQARKDDLRVLAEQLDAKARGQVLAQSQREVDLASMGDQGKLASVQLEYDLKKGLSTLNDSLSAQDQQTLINNAKLIEQKQTIASVAEQLKNQQRVIDLYGVTSDAAKLEYDIKNNILHVEGGINSEQAKQLIANQTRIDQLGQLKSVSELTAEAIGRIDSAFAGAWVSVLDGADNAFEGIKNAFKQTLAEIAHQAITKPILLRVQQSLTSAVGGLVSSGVNAGVSAGASAGASGVSGAASAGALSGLGVYAIAAVAVVAAVSIWNKKQDEKFVKLTAEYKQGNQSLVKVLGVGNQKSQAIKTALDTLKNVNGNVLDVNYSMLRALLDIRAGVGNVAAGFAKTLVGGADYRTLGITEKTTSLTQKQAFITGAGNSIDFASIGRNQGTAFDELVGGFLQSISDSLNNAIYHKKTKVIDAGIQILGGNLADILTGATLQAFNYADVKTTQRVIGINAGAKVKRVTEDLNHTFETQFSQVFEGAGKALKLASTALGVDFDQALNQLTIAPQDLSLKGLKGEALTQEIESFFGSTLDRWAEVLLGGTQVLQDFQKIGESAFDTLVRLASQTNTFVDYAKTLGLRFSATGQEAVYATQQLAALSGGFDLLANALGVYYDKFFTSSEQFVKQQETLTKAFGELGVALPNTRDAFRQIISALDLSTAAGQTQFSALIALSSATDRYLTALDAETTAKAEATKAAQQSLKDTAGRAFESLSKALEAPLTQAQAALSASQQVADSVMSSLRSLRLESVQTALQTRQQAQAQLIVANRLAQAGGSLPVSGQLDEALQTLAQPSQDLFASFEDYARDFYKTQAELKSLGDTAISQVSLDQQHLTALQDLLHYYQTQIDQLNGIDHSVLSVRDAVDQLTQALTAAGSTNLKPPTLPSLTPGNSATTASMKSVLTTSAAGMPGVFNTDRLGQGVDIMTWLQSLAEELRSSQLSISKNTQTSAKLLQRWDIDGLPESRTMTP
jgi:hypothetical protein